MLDSSLHVTTLTFPAQSSKIYKKSNSALISLIKLVKTIILQEFLTKILPIRMQYLQLYLTSHLE